MKTLQHPELGPQPALAPGAAAAPELPLGAQGLIPVSTAGVELRPRKVKTVKSSPPAPEDAATFGARVVTGTVS